MVSPYDNGMGKRRIVMLALASTGWWMTAACHGPQPATPPAKTAAASSVKHYMLRGTVIAVSMVDKTVTINHDAIPGFMPAMTMPYKVKDPGVLTELHPGDRLTATLVDVDESQFYLDDFDVTAQAKPDYKPAVVYHVPTPGDAVPDFTFLNQSGKRIHLSQYRGDVLLITFIYTRCPLSDYCPRMSRNFAQVDKALGADPAQYSRTHLLSVSFDPEYDTPQVLRSYGGAYTGKFTQEDFAHWDFAAPSPASELQSVEQWFGVGVTPGDSPGQLTHSLCTVVVGRDGKIRNWYPTNEWTPEQLTADARKALAG
jgi:protein SCO1/2